MSYGNILSLIDSDLALLTTVRNLLSEAAFPAGPAKTRRLAANAPPRESAALEGAEPPQPPAPAPRRARATRKAATSRKQRTRPTEPSAFAASIPANPVAVSAAAVAERREAQAREATARAEKAPSVTEGTLDDLLRHLKVREAAA